MACPAGTTIRYDIFMRTNPVRGQVRVDELLTFCLIIQGTVITGTVNAIADLMGTNRVLANGVDQITLGFRWGAAQIIIDGFTFPNAAGRRECLIKFQAVAPPSGIAREAATATESAAAAIVVGPEVGDTGTGTGQQT